MLSVEGQYAAIFDLGTNKDFINQGNLIEFIYSRDCGGGLPMFSLEFMHTNSNLLKYLNENNQLKVAYGRDQQNLKKINLRIYGDPYFNKIGNDKFSIKITGFLDISNYFGTTAIVSPKMSGIAFIQEDAKRVGLILDKDNIVSSQDNQTWISFGQSRRKFYMSILMHSFLEKSFPVLSITGKGELRIYDFLKHIQKGNKWKLTKNVTKPLDILYSDYEILKDKSELINFWAGYLSEQPVFNLVDGNLNFNTEDVKNFLSINKNLIRNVKEEVRREKLNYINENLHSNYYRAFQRNLKYSLMYSKSRLGIDILNIFRPIEPLDIIYFEDVQTENNDLLNSYISGRYIVSRVVDTLSTKLIKTHLEITKENFNFLQQIK